MFARASATATASTGRGIQRKGLWCNPSKLLLDPYAKAIDGEIDWYRGVLRVRLRRPRPRRTPTTARHTCRKAVVGDRVLRLGQRPPARRPAPRHGHLRGPRPWADDAPSRRARRHCAAPTPAIAHPAVIEHLHDLGRHRDRTDAGPPVRPRPPPRRAGPAQLLGLQLDRLPRPAQRVHVVGRARPDPGVQDDGQVAPCGRHRGDPRRRLQPHRRGQPPRSDAVDARDRQPGVLPPRSTTTRATTSTSPARATASTCATRTCCS